LLSAAATSTEVVEGTAIAIQYQQVVDRQQTLCRSAIPLFDDNDDNNNYYYNHKFIKSKILQCQAVLISREL